MFDEVFFEGNIPEHIVPSEEYLCRRCGRDVEDRANMLLYNGIPRVLHCPHCGNKQEFLEGQDDKRKELEEVNDRLHMRARAKGVVYRKVEKPSVQKCGGCNSVLSMRPRLLLPLLAPDRVECSDCGKRQHFRHDQRRRWLNRSAWRVTKLMVLPLLLTVAARIGLRSWKGFDIDTTMAMGVVVCPLLVYAMAFPALLLVDAVALARRRARRQPLECQLRPGRLAAGQ